MATHYCLKASFFSVFSLLVSFAVHAQSNAPAEDRPRPEMRAAKLAAKPTLDGVVSGDPAWDSATPASDFTQVQPNEGFPATRQTEVYFGYTDTAIYIGLIAYDDDPSSIIIADSRRDSNLDQTDSFQVVIDGLLDRQNAYLFGTNPAGIEYDAQIIKEGSTGQFGSGGGGFNLNWDGSWNVEARITEYGWSAEMEIPFTTLRYQNAEEQSWGINFQRNIRSNNEIVYWAPLNRQRNINRISEAGTVVGITPPPRRNLQITPYVLASFEEGGNLDGTVDDQEFGVDLKYSITPSLTLDATYNTDFAQVEVDEAVVNLDRFSIFLPEKRPFFLENAGQFTVGNPQEVELFFSRRIGLVAGEPVPIDGGLRLSGRVGSSTNVGLLYMVDEGRPGVAPQNDYVVARVNQELPNRSSIGALVVSRNGDGSISGNASSDENQTYAIDGRWGIGDNLLLEGWLAKTDTPGLTDDDFAFAVKMNYDSENWSSRINWTEVREDFNPEVGFLRRDDFRRAEFFILRRYRPDGPLLEIRPHISIRNFWNLDGFLETSFQHYDVHWEFENGYRIDTGMNYLKDGLLNPFEIIDGVTVPAGIYSGYEAQIAGNTDQSQPLSFSFRSNIGKRFGGDRMVLEPEISFRIGERFTSEFEIEYNDFDLPYPGGNFDVILARARLSYSFTPRILLQALIQYNDESEVLSTNLRFSMLRTANSGLYLVYNEFDEQYPGAPPTGREFILKYSYLFDVFN
ncbi:MAG: DUF5916 domain-containing protein [Woeseiaceae bacterium]|nr:DUF5916 domain-containing protein [Woeseiaceae bacterium]